MAKCNPGVAGTFSGRLGGCEFAVTKTGLTVKRQKIRQSSTSPARVYAQGLQAAAMRQWRLLTDAQRAAWDTAARQYPVKDRFGVGRVRTGFQLFLTIPHDFRFGFEEQWLMLPPTLPTNVIDWGHVTANAGYHLAFTPMWAVGVPVLYYAYVARWQSQYSDRSRKIWRRVAQYYYYDEHSLDFSESLEANNCSFVVGERIAVIGGLYQSPCWPVTHDYGIITVGA